MYLEQGGLIVIEPESIQNLPEGWVRGHGPELTAPNVNNPDDATGDGFITWQGNQFLNQPGNAEILVGLLIGNSGIYRFQWRNQVGSGTIPTDHNDTWVKIEANSFYGQSGCSIVCPKGTTLRSTIALVMSPMAPVPAAGSRFTPATRRTGAFRLLPATMMRTMYSRASIAQGCISCFSPLDLRFTSLID